MAYIVNQINNLQQFGELSTTFILTDTDNIMPTQRADKVFKVDENLAQKILDEKIKTCEFYKNQWDNRKIVDTLLWWDNLDDDTKFKLFDSGAPYESNDWYGNKQALADLMYSKYLEDNGGTI